MASGENCVVMNSLCAFRAIHFIGLFLEVVCLLSTFFKANNLPELLAFCVVSNGVIQDSEIKMAVSIINSDEIIRNKKKAIENFSTHTKLNMSNKRNAEDLYDLNFSTLKAKIAKLESSTEKARVDMIIESMLNSVEEIMVANSRATADEMRGALV